MGYNRQMLMRKIKLLILAVLCCIFQVSYASEEFMMCGLTISDAIATSPTGIVAALNEISGVTASGTITYDVSTRTLTLNNARVSFTGSASVLESKSTYSTPAVTVQLIGENSLHYNGTGYYCAIQLSHYSDLTITGSGSLNAKSDTYFAIHTAHGTLRINNTTIVAESDYGMGNNSVGGKTYINNSNVTVSQLLRQDYVEVTNCYIIAPSGAVVRSGMSSGGYGIDKKGASGNIVISTEEPVNTYTVTLVQPEHGSINVTESVNLSEVPEGTLLHFTATPDANYELDTWSGCAQDGTITVNGDVTVSCTFKLKEMNVTLATPTNGSVTVTSGGNTVDLSQPVLYGTDLVFTATPNSSYKFAQYLVTREGESAVNEYTNPMTLQVTKNTTIQVVFVQKPSYTITVDQPANGTIALQETGIDLTSVEEGTILHFIATPNEGYEFGAWSGCEADGSLTVTANATISASFNKKAYHVTFVDFDDQVLKEEDVLFEEAATAPAAPVREGYTFAGWDKDFSSITAAITVKATYTKNSYHVTFVDFDDRVLKEEDVLFEEAATAPADPAREGYTFAGWDKDFSSITAAITVKATYTINTYMVTVVAENGSVTAKDADNNPVDLSQEIEYGKVIFLTATADEGYVFESWENYDETTGLTVTENVTITANFVLKPTGIDNIFSNEKVNKVLIDGQVYIIRGDGSVFNAQGAHVKIAY